MNKLNSVEANEAWEEFRDHLIDCGMLLSERDISPGNFHKEVNRQNLVKMAFKQGYASRPIEKTGDSKGGKEKRVQRSPRVVRSPRVRLSDGQALYDMLVEKGRATQTSEIVRKMNNIGRNHWNTNNATSFINTAVQDGHDIKRIGRGLYQVEKEDKK